MPPSVKYIKQRTRLKVRYKGKAYKAMLRLDGQVRYGNAVLQTPTAAAKAVTGRSAINGWRFWHYERAPGDWCRWRRCAGECRPVVAWPRVYARQNLAITRG